MDLIIVESPKKVPEVQKYAEKLGLKTKVMATCGHLVDLPPMAEGVGVDIARFTGTAVVPRSADAERRIAQLKSAIRQADRVVVAADADREGEAIASQVWGLIPSGRAWRASFEEITAAGVQRGLKEMQPRLNVPALEAATARRLIDRLAGWHATAVVFEKLRGHRGISAGRLQSAALRLVVERQRENASFKPTTTFGIRIQVRTPAGNVFFARLVDTDGSRRSFATRNEAEAFKAPARVLVASVQKDGKSQRPKPPFEATSWLQVAQKALGLSVKEATAATQALFEGGRTTYPRTDTVRVAEEAILWARAEILRRFGAEYLPEKPWVHKDRSGIVQGAHEAIRPTVCSEALELEQRRSDPFGHAYGLIEERFLASQAAARIVEQTIANLTGDGFAFRATGEVEIFPGWRRVLATHAEEEAAEVETKRDRTEEDVAEGALPRLSANDELRVTGVEVVPETTRPKPLFSQASLVAELKRLGIGRPSTYQSLIPLLFSRGWVTEEIPRPTVPGEKKNRGSKKALPVLVPTQVGFDLADFLKEAFPGLVDYEFTAALEAALDEIEEGKKNYREVGRNWWSRFEVELGAARNMVIRQPERKDLGPCPKCRAEGRAGRLRLLKGTSAKSGKAYEFAACDVDTKDARFCGHTAPVHDSELQKLAPCPECQGDMRPVRRKDGGHSWVCAKHGWFLANGRWEVVKAPICQKCGQPMSHRERSGVKGQFFWACFEDRIFTDSDAFGTERRKRTTGR